MRAFERWLTESLNFLVALVHWTFAPFLVRYGLAWALVGGLAASQYHAAFHAWDAHENFQPGRADGNAGHATVDFAGQWLLGRLLVTGHGRELYHRGRLWHAAHAAFPRSAESPKATSHDAEALVYEAFMGHDTRAAVETAGSFAAPLAAADAVQAAASAAAGAGHWDADGLAPLTTKRLGGSIYPPTHAFLIAPLALGDHPQWAYRVMQVLVLIQTFAAGLAVSVLTRGRVWWPLATALILVFPGTRGALNLGQNAVLTLTIAAWGWVLMSRGRDGLGGMVWGLLVYKPVWLLAFFLVPVVTRRWVACASMIVTAGALAAATLPVVGVECWRDWRKVGVEAAALYDVDTNWVHLSRDLLGIPRRYILDFDEPREERDRFGAAVAGWTFWTIVVGLTAVRGLLAGRDRRREATGPLAGFLLLGAALSCYHFMYYDLLLASLGVFAMLDPPRQFLRPALVAVHAPSAAPPRLDQLPREPATRPAAVAAVASVTLSLVVLVVWIETHLPHWDLSATLTGNFLPPLTGHDSKPLATAPPPGLPLTTHLDGRAWSLVVDPKEMVRPRPVTFNTNVHGTPWDTFALLLLWAWAGVKSLTPRASDAADPAGRPRVESSQEHF
jgi:arabinofuranan 3-O-arabinosyltransferase